MAPKAQRSTAKTSPRPQTAMPEVAMIMGAGFGTRMRPLTNDRPKPMVEVQGRPMIDHAIAKLKDAGIKKLVVNLHYKGDMLRKHLNKTLPKGMEIAFSEEPEILDTGGGVTKALPLLGDAPFFVVNGDMFWRDGTRSTLTELADRWDDQAMDGLLLMVPTVNVLGYFGLGDFTMTPDGKLVRRQETRVAPYLYGGIQLVHPRLFAKPPKGPFSTNLMWDRALEAARLYGLRHEGEWLHIDTPQSLDLANRLLSE